MCINDRTLGITGRFFWPIQNSIAAKDIVKVVDGPHVVCTAFVAIL